MDWVSCFEFGKKFVVLELGGVYLFLHLCGRDWGVQFWYAALWRPTYFVIMYNL